MPRLATGFVEHVAAESPDAEESPGQPSEYHAGCGTAADDRLPDSPAGGTGLDRCAGPSEHVPDGPDRPTATEWDFLAGTTKHQCVRACHARNAPGCAVPYAGGDESGGLQGRRAPQGAAARLECPSVPRSAVEGIWHSRSCRSAARAGAGHRAQPGDRPAHIFPLSCHRQP